MKQNDEVYYIGIHSGGREYLFRIGTEGLNGWEMDKEYMWRSDLLMWCEVEVKGEWTVVSISKNAAMHLIQSWGKK